MADLFRKAALDKVSSPDQLDRQIRLLSPSFWIAILGGGLIIVVALIWSVFSRLPVNVTAGGMYMGANGINSVIAEADGLVSEVYVSDGDQVSSGQEIARLDSSAYDDEIASLEARRNNVDMVTFWSSDDPETADTKPLLDIKSQLDLSKTTLTADQISLREREQALSKQKGVASKAKSSRDSARERYEKAQAEYIAVQERLNKANEAYNAAASALSAALEANEKTDPDPFTPEQIAQLQAAATAAKTELDNAGIAAKKAELEVNNAQTAYSQAQQTYTTENQTMKSISDTVSQLRAKVKADKSGSGDQISSLEKQFDSAKGGVLDQLDQEIAKQQKNSNRMLLKSRVDGKIAGLNIARGNAVQAGMVICRVTFAGNEEDVVLYVPVSEGKKIKKGMDAVIYLSTVNRQEYGHMDGTVTKVSDRVVSSEDMLNQLGDQALVQAYQQSGPVIRVSCSLKKDKSTKSGYEWSSKKGAEVSVDDGTVVTADIITEEKAPITMLIPLLKEKLTVRSDDQQTSQQAASQEGGK